MTMATIREQLIAAYQRGQQEAYTSIIASLEATAKQLAMRRDDFQADAIAQALKPELDISLHAADIASVEAYTDIINKLEANLRAMRAELDTRDKNVSIVQ